MGDPTTSDGAPRRDEGHFSLLHRQPVILFAPDWEVADPNSALRSVLEQLPPRRTHLVVGPSWALEDSNYCDGLVAGLRSVRESADHIHMAVLGRNGGEIDALRARGETPVPCSAAAFVRDDFFFPILRRRRRFDAIYDAKWADYKRHHLAGRVASLALITYLQGAHSTTAYSQRAFRAVSHATWLTPPWNTSADLLSPHEVNQAYNAARVGLCLSGVEGHMNVSVQYLLAGLPVVTTRNIGGRDEFFHPAHTRWVDDDVDAVADAVAELARLELRPPAVRGAALQTIRAHRGRFLAWINGVIDHEGGVAGAWADGWPAGLPNKLREPMVAARDVLRQVASS